ncbi:MAG: hypothetical protein JW830_05470 [Bacteroidales bacterium]|nr:hypothetical protein [Bacteroidales bacterium]
MDIRRMELYKSLKNIGRRPGNFNLLFRGLVFLFLVFFSNDLAAQNVGDYQSAQDGNWDALNRWTRWNGSSWAAPTAGEGYPGQNASPTTVTILNGHDLTVNVSPANTIGTLVIGQGTSGTLQSDNSNRTLTINTLEVATGATFNMRRLTLTVNNTTSISGTINDNNNNGSNTFTGLVTINNGGSFSPTANSPFVFRGGIVNDGTFSKTGTGSSTFNTNSQTISGNNSLAFAGNIIIDDDITLGITTSIDFNGTNFTNNSNAANALNATAGTFTFLPNAAQNINGTGTGTISFYNFVAAGGNTKTANLGFTVVNAATINNGVTLTLGTSSKTIHIGGNLTLDGTLNFGTAASTINLTGDLVNVTGTITMQGAGQSHALNLAGSSNDISTFNTTAGSGSTVNYNRTGDQQVFASNNYQNLIVSNGGIKTLAGALSVAGVLNFNSGVLQLGNSNLTLTNNATTAIQGTPNSTSMVETNGTGYFIRNVQNTNLPILYPIGSGGYYSPVSVSAISGTISGTMSIRAIPSAALGSKSLNRYWDIITSTTGKTITATFTYDPADAPAAPTNIWVKPDAGAWQVPAGTASFGANGFTVTSTTNIGTTLTSWTASALGTYYSYQTGSWNNPTTWTSDPGGTTQVGTTVPGDNDAVVILDGRTVSLPANIASTGLEININSGGTIDMATYGFTSGLAELKGQGTLKLASTSFPAAAVNTFVNAGGGTTEYYNTANFDLLVTQTAYNNLRINAPGFTATQMNNLVLNGDLHVKQGTYRINDDTGDRRELTINGDVTVDAGASLTVGTGVTNSTTTPTGIYGGTAPYINYYYAQSHSITLYGDFTNNGTVKFTNLAYPIFNAFPPTTVGATSGFATVYFRGATNNTLTCNNTTDFYNLVLDKGVDQSYSLTVYSSAYANFRLFGANTSGGDGGGSNPNLKKALWIRTGTLVLKGLTTIPSLSEGTCDSGTGGPNSDFYIPANGALILDGPEVVVLSTADDYQEVNVAYGVSGGSGLVNGVGQGGCSSFSIYGKIQINDGYFSTRESGGFITWDLASGQFVIRGGTIDAKQFRAAGGAGGLASFDQSGGTFYLRGRFQRTPSAYSSMSDLTNVTTGTLNTTRSTAGLEGIKGTFNLNDAANVLALSGGTIRIYDVCGNGSVAAQQKVFEVLSSTGNINVTGGTLELIPTNGTGTNSPNHIILSNASLGNLTINRASSASVVLLNTYHLRVINNLTLTSGDFDANGLNVSVGGNMSVASGTTYTPGNNWTIFNGTGNQSFTINTASALALKKLKLDKPAGTTLTLAGSQSNLSVADSMMIMNCNLADGGKTINFTTSATTTTSYLYNSGIHSGAGKIMMADDDPQVISGDGDGIFQNLELNNTDASAAPVSLAADMVINGTLTFSQDKLFNIGSYGLELTSTATIANAGTNRYIQTSGGAGDGGLTLNYPSGSALTFPIGSVSTSHSALPYYTPATIGFTGTPTALGSITVIPVGYEHPATTNNGRSLTYFWRVKSNGFTLGGATVNQGYTYNENDVITGGDITEAGYLAARYDASAYTWTKGDITDVDESGNIVGEPGAGTFLQGVTFIDGDYTAGDDDATDPFGTPTIFYSRINGAGAGNGLWSNANSWSYTSHTGPANTGGNVPNTNDIVIIGGNDSIYLGTVLNTANTDVRNCASLQIERGSALDIGYNPGCNFGMVQTHPNGNGNFRLTTRQTSPGNYVFPSGDFTDFNANRGTTEFYTTNSNPGAIFILPANTSTYGTVILSPLGGSNIIFPNIPSMTVLGDLITRGQDWRSWLAMTWTSDYGVIVAKTVTVKGNFFLQGGSFLYMGNGATAQNIIIDGDVIVDPGAGIDVYGSSYANTMSIGGSLINNSNNDMTYPLAGDAGSNVRFYVSGTRKADVIFFGSNSSFITNTGITPATGSQPNTTFANVRVNKGISQGTTLTCDIAGTLTTLNDNWLTLQNGTLRYMRTNPNSDFTITQGSAFTIPATAGLYVDYANSGNRNILIANSGSNTNDLYLNGKLTIINGNVYVGPTNGTTANNNDIEYSGGGYSEIEIQGGTLVVNGQIRRNPATTNGILDFTQSGGTVVINGQNDITTNAKLEILNEGSSFNMSGGTLTIVRGGGGNTYGDLYLRPETSSVTGGEIIFTQIPPVGPVVNEVQSYILDANVPLNHLTIIGKTAATARNATVTLLISPLVLNGDLTLSNNVSFFDANTNFDIDVTVNGDFTNNGTYNHYDNLTTFSGGVQTLQGSSATDFYDLLVAPVTSLSLIRNITVYNDLTLNSGQLLGSTYDINVEGDLINNANYDGDAATGGVILNGSELQYVSGTGSFGRLELDNTEGARTLNDITLQKNLILTNGVFDINQYLLTLGLNSNIEGSSFSAAKMIASDGVFSNVGINKYFGIYSGPAQTFTYPLGTAAKYTPAVLTYTSNTNVGSIRLNNINDHHPGVFDNTNVLQYYWEIESSGIDGFNGNIVLSYLNDDVAVTGSNTEGDYIAARLLIPGTSWIKAAPGPATDNVDEAANTITYNYNNTDNLSGEYTAGIDPAIPDNVPEYTSIADGVWSDETNWIQTGGDAYPCPVGGPNGFIVIVDHEISADANYCSAYRTEINGQLNVISPYFGHNFGTVSGGGTLYLEGGTLPAGKYNDFLDCSGNSILEFGGNTDYAIVADLYSSIPRLHFTGTGTRTLPNKDLTICQQLLIDGPTLNNSTNNRMLTIQGTMERYNSGAFISGSGAGATISFAGSAAQTLGGALGDFTGANSFNNLEIDNTAGLTINAGGAIEVSGNLMLTNGNINTTSSNTLTITNTAINCVVPSGGSASSFVNGPLTKSINQGDNFLFPIGQGTELGNKMSVSSSRTGTILWTAEYFTPNPTYTSLTSPLSYVNSDEFWTVSAPSGSRAVINIQWDPLSDLTPLMTENGLTDMRVAQYNSGTTSWEEIASDATGNNNNGTVYTSSRITISASGSENFTTACINVTKPRASLTPSGPVCGAAGIPVTFTASVPINLNYILAYKKDGVAQAPVTVSSLPYVLPTDATGATYQLTGFTFNNPPHAGPIGTGVVDPGIVTTYTVPTTASAGSDQSICGGTSAALAGNAPTVGTGLWTITGGTGGTVQQPTVNNSSFSGNNGTTYTLTWTISNGTCASSDNVIIDFPLLPVQPGAFTSSDNEVCQGQSGVAYSVLNDLTVTYNWSYSGSGATITGTGNSVSVDYSTSATSGTISVTTTNGCGTSSALTLDVTVQLLPITGPLYRNPND